ncbi:MAG: TonB-dependent receptor plug domain-containing protein [Sedimentisphaerales bacterium]
MKFETRPLFLENIERIEVIRGAGGVIWGVNAMNSVINIITKRSADTQGGFVYGGFNNKEFEQGLLRFGGTNGPLSWRGTMGGLDHGDDPEHSHRAFQATGRADLKLGNDMTLTFSGGHQNSTGDHGPHSMQYINSIWQKKLEEGSSIQIRWSESFHHDRFEALMRTREDMLEIQHHFTSDIHSIVWGADYTRDTGHTKHWRPDSFANDQASAFIEDEIALADNLWLTIGNRQHYNELTHHDWAGRVVLIWKIAPEHFIRWAVSKSFRRPLFSEEFDYRDNGKTLGNDSLRNERLVSYELGYRGKLKDNLELNVEGFVNRHKDLIAKKGSNPAIWNNVLDVTTYGIETAINSKPFDWWLVRGFHAYEHQTDEKNLNDSDTGELSVWTIPKHKVGLTNRFYLDKSTILNTQLYWSDTFFSNKHPGETVVPYFRFDIRLGKTFWNGNAELALGINNITDQSHSEGGDYKVPRQIYFQFFYKF